MEIKIENIKTLHNSDISETKKKDVFVVQKAGNSGSRTKNLGVNTYNKKETNDIKRLTLLQNLNPEVMMCILQI